MALVDKIIPNSTERLSFRFFNKSDLSLVEKLDTNSKVMKFLGGVKSSEETELALNKYLNYHLQHPGYGYWYAQLKDSDVFAGWFLVKLLPETGETEIGYRLLPEFWGKGIATEGAKNMVRYAVENLCVRKVVGVASPDNIASRKVLENAGLTFKKYGRFYQVECAYYSHNSDQ